MVAENSAGRTGGSKAKRIVDPEFGRNGVQAGIENADPAMFVTHLGAAQLSPEGIRDATALLLESVAKKYRNGPSGYETEKYRDLMKAAETLRSLRP